MSAFHARVLASDDDFFDGPCESMTVPCTDGAMGILLHHSNMIAAAVPGELRFQPEGGSLRTAAVSAGLGLQTFSLRKNISKRHHLLLSRKLQ